MEKELNYNSQALAYTLVIYGILLTICYLTYLSIPYTQTQMEVGGLEVNYGTSEKGMGEDFTSTESPASSTKPNHKQSPNEKVVTPSKNINSTSHSDKEILTQNNEDAEAVHSGKKNTRMQSQVQNPNPNPAPKPPKVNQNALYKGASSSGSGSGDGNSDQAGNQGSLSGSVLSRNYGASGGGGGGVSLNLAGRKFISRPTLSDDGQTEGKIAVSITVDREGNIVSAEAGGRGTTIQNEDLWKKCEQAVIRSKLNPISAGPDIQSGKVVFSFKLL